MIKDELFDEYVRELRANKEYYNLNEEDSVTFEEYLSNLYDEGVIYYSNSGHIFWVNE